MNAHKRIINVSILCALTAEKLTNKELKLYYFYPKNNAKIDMDGPRILSLLTVFYFSSINKTPFSIEKLL